MKLLELVLEFDQVLFKKAVDIWNALSRRNPDPEREARTARLADCKQRLTILARALNSAAIELYTAEREGGWKDNVFFLPAEWSRAATKTENEQYYLFRVVMLSLQRLHGMNWPAGTEHSLEESRRAAAECAPQLLEALDKHFPAFSSVARQVIDTERGYQQTQRPGKEADMSMLWGHWMHNRPGHKKRAKDSHTPDDDRQTQDTPTSELPAPAREEIQQVEVDDKAIKDFTLVHTFEKVDTLEEFNGNWRDLDGSDELEDHAEALREVQLRRTVRVDSPVHSVYTAEWFGGGTLRESRDAVDSAPHVCYDEWDAARRSYRKDHCRVYPLSGRESNPAYVLSTRQQFRATLNSLRRRFTRTFTNYESLRRQSDGSDPDLDALVDAFADMHAGKTPSDRLYVTSRKRRRDIALLFLLDMSLSTDAYTKGRRIIDVEKQSVLIFGDVLHEYGDRFRIDGFSSRTRNHCEYLTLKHFDDAWPAAAARVAAASPRGYTRIGPALRHATHLLEREAARKRWIILLSDGKPNDYDRYEGRYGISDTRQAIREATRKGINTFALAVEAKARDYLPQMLGPGAYRILPRPEILPDALSEFYLRIAVG